TISLITKKIDLILTTGKVLNANKNMETKVSGSGGGGGSFRGTGYTRAVKIKSETTVHDQFFLEDKDGMEHSYQLANFNIACREGNMLTVLSVNSRDGRPIGVVNHSTNKAYYNSQNLRKAGGPN